MRPEPVKQIGHVRCPHGDDTCPCIDGDACHYEGSNPMECPHPPDGLPHKFEMTMKDGRAVTFESMAHCHVEGCTWDQDTCGLVKVRKIHHRLADLPTVPGDIEWMCGATRAFDSIEHELRAFS